MQAISFLIEIAIACRGIEMDRKILVIMLILGLVFGLIGGYCIAPKVDTPVFERRIAELEGQIGVLESQIKDKDQIISNLESQMVEKNATISKLQVKLDEKDAQIDNAEAEVSTLQEELNELKKLVPPYRNGEWNLIESFEGSSSLTTDYFYIAEAEIRVNWTWISEVSKYAGFSFSLYKEGEASWTAFEFDLDSTGTTHVHNLTTDNYYLEITEANIDEWTITVEIWIPE